MKKYLQLLTVLLFCGFLGIMGILYVILPEQDFSQREKRYLAEKPELTARTLFSGDWGEEMETYLADHMPARDFFVGLNAYFEKFTGRVKTGDIWCVGDRLLEAPKAMDPEAIEKNMGAIAALSGKAEIPVDLMIVPSAGWFCGLPEYKDREIIDKIYGLAEPEIQTLDLRQVLSEDSFYRTDHHWTSRGAYEAYCTYVSASGMEPRQDFKHQTYEGFHGSTYSRSGLWLTAAEPLETWTGSEDLQVEIGEKTCDSLFFLENLQKEDMYTVFLGGNHPRVRIRNPKAQGKLLVIRDSFSNCLGGFLAESFGEVVLLDLRYEKQPVSQLLQQEDFDRILICYGLGNFLTDKNLVFLKR